MVKVPGKGTHSCSLPEDRGLKGCAFRSSSKASTHTTEVSPSVQGLLAIHAVHGLGSPYIPHAPTDVLQLGLQLSDFAITKSTSVNY
jgi:hypothetical protein